MYKIKKIQYAENELVVFVRENADGSITSFGKYIDNTDYANFKTAILEDKAQLQDADGNTMTAEQAKDFIKELP